MESQGLIYTKEKDQGTWSAHPRCARAVSQLIVERQYRWSVSCNVIA